MEDADRIDASTDDMTAADTAPSPSAATSGGVKCRRSEGRTSAGAGAEMPAADQFAPQARMPSTAGGTAATRHTSPATTESRLAVCSSRAASTRWKYTC